MISVTITDRSGRTLSGQTVEAFWTSVAHAQPFSVGINCALGATRDAALRRGARATSRPASSAAIPNAGLPNGFGGYDETPRAHGRPSARDSPASGWLNIVGGCCGTTPDAHPRDRRRPCKGVRAAAGPVAPSTRAARSFSRARAAGRSGPRRNFVMIGERTNVTGSREVRAADQGRRLRGGRRTSRASRSRAGANILDVNMDEGLIDGEEAMTTFLNLIAAEPDIARVPDHDRQLEVVGHRGGAEVRAGQGRSSTRSASRKARTKFLEQARLVRALRRGGRRHGLRREGPGRHRRRARSRSASAPTELLTEEVGFAPTGHHLRPEHPDRRHRHRGAQQLRRRVHRGGRAGIKTTLSRREDVAAASATSRSRSAATTPSARR